MTIDRRRLGSLKTPPWTTNDPGHSPTLVRPAAPEFMPSESASLRAAFDAIGRRAVATLACAVDEVHEEACHRHRPWDFAYAERTSPAPMTPASGIPAR